ncbi:MAG: glycosyl hydrolase, partial [Fulvivirga sp.]|nr:glycosyl hydrolase [Fulvivirga sp.]
MKSTSISLLAFIICLLMTLGQAEAQNLSDNTLSQLKFRHIGPPGNRVTSVVGLPGNDMLFYVGAASGGIWKTEDGGLNWTPIFEGEDVHSIGALAIAPSDPQVIYAGTGEAFIRSNISIGTGMYRSDDGGATWEQIGLVNTGRISRIIVHPDDPNTLFVAALGHAYAQSEARGVFKSQDGGKSWKKVLFVNEDTGASDLVMDPANPRIMLAGMWQLSLRPWNRTSGGKGSGLYQSKDGGETWQKLEGNGLPEGVVGKIALAMSRDNPDKVYALIETGDGVEEMDGKTQSGELWVSQNKGKSWQLMSSDREMSGRQAYYTRMAVSPEDANEIYFISASMSKSIDGGKTLLPGIPQANWDHHHMWIDPLNADNMAVAGDGGISFSQNGGKSWHRVQLPVAQLYHVTTDSNVPYFVLTNRQDGPSMRGPSRSNTSSFFGTGIIPTGAWHDIGGGESGFATPDPENPDIVWSSASGFGALGGVVTRYDVNSRQFRHVEVWPEFTAGVTAENVKYRFQWTFPLLISPHDHNTVYVTSQHVHRTTNGGQTWEVISPDLTL